MPSSEEHFGKYNLNRACLDDMTGTYEHRDWIVVVAFYSALHLVERKYFDISSAHNPDHGKRNDIVHNWIYFEKIRRDYKFLCDGSWRARYSADKINRTDAEKAVKCLENIEKNLV